jgi:amidase
MCGVAHGTDGTGSLRNPPAWLGVIGFKPGRGLIPGPAALTGWHGMVVNGPIARRAADVGAFLDATAAPGHLDAATTEPPRLRIGLTTRPPPGMGGKLENTRREAVHEAAEVLRSLGHEVLERDPELPRATGLAISTRYYGGIAEDIRQLPHPERLEARTRSVGRLGRALTPLLGVASRIERAAAAALDEVHRECDLLLFPGSIQPPEPIGRFHDRGALITAYTDTAQVAFQPLWNLVGRPAVMVPWGRDGNGLPVAVQFGGRPGSEKLLLSLVGQLEELRGWSQDRPPIATNHTHDPGDQPGLAG